MNCRAKTLFLILSMLLASLRCVACPVTDIANDSCQLVTTGADMTVVCEEVTPRADTLAMNGDSISGVDRLDKSDKSYWKKALMNGTLNINDESIQYPGFLDLCVKVYRWGDKFFNSYDSEYVQGTGYRCKVFAKSDNWTDGYRLTFPGKTPINMLSSVTPTIGLYVAYMAVSFGYTANANSLFSNKPVAQKKLQFDFNCALFSLEAYFNKNTGGTRIRQFGDYNNRRLLNRKFDGLQFESYGFDLYYVANHKRYSQGSAYAFSKIQKKSAGSIIGGITVCHQNIDVDFSDIDEAFLPYIPIENKRYKFIYNDYCALLGYGYNWVIKKNCLINLTALPSIGWKHCSEDNVDGTGNIFSINSKFKFGFVYNLKRFFCGTNLKMDLHWYNSKNYSFYNTIFDFSFTVGMRFDVK